MIHAETTYPSSYILALRKNPIRQLIDTYHRGDITEQEYLDRYLEIVDHAVKAMAKPRPAYEIPLDEVLRRPNGDNPHQGEVSQPE